MRYGVLSWVSTAFPKATPHSHTKGGGTKGGVALREGVCIACRSGLADLNACDDHGETALHLCVMYNNIEIAEVTPTRRLGCPIVSPLTCYESRRSSLLAVTWTRLTKGSALRCIDAFGISAQRSPTSSLGAGVRT